MTDIESSFSNDAQNSPFGLPHDHQFILGQVERVAKTELYPLS